MPRGWGHETIKMQFGKHKGTPILDVPTDYLHWLLDKVELQPWFCKAIEEELEYRTGEARKERSEGRENHSYAHSNSSAQLTPVNRPYAEKIIKAGYRQLSKEYHPDVGGSTEEMTRINSAMDVLRSFVGN